MSAINLLLCVTVIVLVISFFVDGDTDSSSYAPIIATYPALFAANSGAFYSLQKMKKAAAIKLIRKKKLKGGNMAASEMIQELVGKTVLAYTLTVGVKGKVTQAQDNWLKIAKQTKNGEVEYIVNYDLIVSIKVLD